MDINRFSNVVVSFWDDKNEFDDHEIRIMKNYSRETYSDSNSQAQQLCKVLRSDIVLCCAWRVIREARERCRSTFASVCVHFYLRPSTTCQDEEQLCAVRRNIYEIEKEKRINLISAESRERRNNAKEVFLIIPFYYSSVFVFLVSQFLKFLIIYLTGYACAKWALKRPSQNRTMCWTTHAMLKWRCGGTNITGAIPHT